jgi:methionyl-tRNA synthetase
MSTTARRLLVTSALPYANGPIHLGHLVEYIQTDIWVRFQKSRGHECHYVCADDAHGTAIMLKAEQNGVTPEEQIATVKADHERDFADFLIRFDNYHSTHSPENREFSETIYRRNRDGGHIATRPVRQSWRSGSKAACRTGTFPAMRRISASRFPTRRASISTCGSTRPSATSAASPPVRQARA